MFIRQIRSLCVIIYTYVSMVSLLSSWPDLQVHLGGALRIKLLLMAFVFGGVFYFLRRNQNLKTASPLDYVLVLNGLLLCFVMWGEPSLPSVQMPEHLH